MRSELNHIDSGSSSLYSGIAVRSRQERLRIQAEPKTLTLPIFRFPVDEDYSEGDLERDLKKTQTLPFMQVGTPSPYRAPSRSRITQVVRTTAPPDAANSTQPIVSARPNQVKSTTTGNAAAELPVGLRTPSNQATEWNKPKPPAANMPVPNFAAALETEPSEASRAPSTQKSSAKIVPSRYMQATQKVDPASKTGKKTSSRPLRAVDINTNTVCPEASDKRRLTIAGTKKVSAKSTGAPRTSVGPSTRPSTASTATTNNTANSTAVAATAAAPPSDSIFAASSARGSISTSSIPLSSSQADLRAALLARREQKAAVAATTKQNAQKPGSTRTSLGPNGPPSSRPSLSNSRDLPMPSAKPTPGAPKATLTRQKSNVESTLHRANSNPIDSYSQPSSGKVSVSRHLNFKSSAPEPEPLFEEAGESSAPTPTRTPGTLKRSFSTSSLKKLQTSKPATSQAGIAATHSRESSTSSQYASLSARVAQVTQSSTSEHSSGSQVAAKPNAPTIQSVHLEAQILQTQLLQWHFINHRLEQAREAKKVLSTHMIMAVMAKIDEMRSRTDELSAQLSVRQAKVYESELEHFKLTCLAPIMYSVHSFLTKYNDTADQLERDSHKMPTHGVTVSDVYSLLETLEESHLILDRLQSEFSEEFAAWEETGHAAQRLASIVREETTELSAYSEMLHAFSHLSTNEASLVFHKLQLENQAKARIGGL